MEAIIEFIKRIFFRKSKKKTKPVYRPVDGVPVIEIEHEIKDKQKTEVKKQNKQNKKPKKQGVNKMVVEVMQVKNGDSKKLFRQYGDIDTIRCFDLSDDDRLVIKLRDNDEILKIKYGELKRAFENESPYLYKTHKNLDTFMKLVEQDKDSIKDLKAIDLFEGLDFPELIDFKDITDKEFNEFEKIEAVTLESEGLYIGNGIRFIELTFNDTIREILNKDKKSKIKLHIHKKDSREFQGLEFPIKRRVLEEGEGMSPVLELDTDRFLDFFDESEKEGLFGGYIIVEFEIGDGAKYRFDIFFELKMINPLFFIQNTNVGVDFGTSSTCVSINQGRELVAFTDNPEDIDDYENATSMIIFNWKKIYQQWVNKEITMPHFYRSNSDEFAEDVDIKKGHFNYSNYIKKELKEAPNAKTIDAIISEIKLLPEKLEDDRVNKDTFMPFDEDFKRVVKLTDDIEEEDDENLNPIALYGYLIGRSLNAQIKHQIYVNYHLTMPVKFSESQKKAILGSLENGIKRALPIGVREKIKVTESYPESVALLGAAKKLKHFKLKDIEEDAYPFAVFDFGGGTLDFAFGIYRKSVKDDRAVLENEMRYRDMIHIFKIDGMDIGGEKIIDRLSYLIYKDNQELMKEREIPIFIPNHEQGLNPYPANLLSKTHIAKLNLKNISEKISREFFINGDVSTDINVELFSIHSSENTESLQLHIIKDNLDEKLNDILEDAVENFKYILENTFRTNEEILAQFGYDEFNIEKVKIFQAGNASRNETLKGIFDEKFENHPNIIFLESNDEDEMKKITPKNAVARGVLFLEGTGYHYQSIGMAGLDRYIWSIEDIEEDEEEAEAKLSRGETALDREFERISRINGEQFPIYFSDVAHIEGDNDENLHSIYVNIDYIDIGDAYFMYAKPYKKDIIEVRFGDDEGIISDDSYFIDLDRGEFVKGGE